MTTLLDALKKDGHIMLDNFMLSTFKECPRRFLYRILLKRVPVADSRTPLEFGIAVHKALELFSKGVPPHECAQRAVELFSPHENMRDEKRTCGKLRDLLLTYFEHFSHSNMHPLKGMTEVGFAIPLSSDVIFCGRIDDFWTIDEYPGELYPVDHKTTSSLTNYVVKPNAQFTGYIYAARELFENVGGLVVNLIGVFKNKPLPLADGSGWRKGSSPDDVFFRIRTTRTEEELEEWKEETLWWTERLVKCCEEGFFPLRTETCGKYFSVCPYVQVCNAPSSMREEILMSGAFKEEEWEPYLMASL